MKLFINTKKMTFNEEDNLMEHEIILNISDTKFYGYNYMIELSDNDKFIKNAFFIIYRKDKDGKDTKDIEGKIFKVREQKTWNSFPLYKFKDGKIISFDYTKYSYFSGTDRRMILAKKINQLYNIPSELKILRKTLKYIMDTLDIEYPGFFKKYNNKIEDIIKRNPK